MNKRKKPKTRESASPVQYFAPASSAQRRIENSLMWGFYVWHDTSCHKLYPNSNLEMQNNQIKFDSSTCLNVCLAAAKDPWAAELRRVANPKPRHCHYGTQSTSVGTQLRYVTRNLSKQRPLAFHCTPDPVVRQQLWEENNAMNILETTLPNSDDLELASSAWLTLSCRSIQMWCVCVCVYIYIYIYLYIYCILPSFKILYWWPNGDRKLQKHEANSK